MLPFCMLILLIRTSLRKARSSKSRFTSSARLNPPNNKNNVEASKMNLIDNQPNMRNFAHKNIHRGAARYGFMKNKRNCSCKRYYDNIIFIKKHNIFLPTNHLELNLREMMKHYLHCTITIFTQSSSYNQCFSGILTYIGYDYVELINLRTATFRSYKYLYKNFIVDIPIANIAAVSYFTV